jgi:hypothetical protein
MQHGSPRGVVPRRRTPRVQPLSTKTTKFLTLVIRRARRDRTARAYARARPRTIRKENSTRAARAPAVRLQVINTATIVAQGGTATITAPIYSIAARGRPPARAIGCTVHAIAGCAMRAGTMRVEASTALASRARQAFIRATRRDGRAGPLATYHEGIGKQRTHSIAPAVHHRQPPSAPPAS